MVEEWSDWPADDVGQTRMKMVARWWRNEAGGVHGIHLLCCVCASSDDDLSGAYGSSMAVKWSPAHQLALEVLQDRHRDRSAIGHPAEGIVGHANVVED